MPGGSGRTAKGRRGRKACRSPSTGSNADLDSLLDDPDIDISRPSADEDTAQSEVAARPTPEPDEQAPEELNPEPDHETASDGGSASSRSKRSKKKKKKTCHLRDENEEALTLEWIAANPILWNTRDKEFKRKDKKDRLWEEKAEEMGYDVDVLKTWYTDLRDWNTKLMRLKSGDPCKVLTEREQWILDRFAFLRTVVRHRRAPVRSVQEALARSSGDLAEAERIAACDRLQVTEADLDDSTASSTISSVGKSTGRANRSSDDPALRAVAERMEAAQAEIAAVRQAMTTAEPATERSTFIDWVMAACKVATEDQWLEFQTTFFTMHAKWKADDRRQSRQNQRTESASTATAGVVKSSIPSHLLPPQFSQTQDFQPMPHQWRRQLPGEVSMWASQSPEYMTNYMAQPHLQQLGLQQPPAQFSASTPTSSVISRPSATGSGPTSSSGTPSVIRYAMDVATNSMSSPGIGVPEEQEATVEGTLGVSAENE